MSVYYLIRVVIGIEPARNAHPQAPIAKVLGAHINEIRSKS